MTGTTTGVSGGVLGPVRSRLIETLAGRSDEVPAWVLRLEFGEDEGFFGPGSAAWAVHGGMPTLVAGVRALLLQALHPGALAGVRDFSRYREDPLGRLAGTIQWIHTVTFGSRGQAIAGSEMVKSLHRRVTGTFVDGHGVARPYSANDPELARWVHLAFTDAFLTAHERWGGPLPGGADGYVGEWATAADLMGVPDAPRTTAELRTEIDATTDAGELRGGPEVEEIVRFIRRAPLRRMLRPSYRVVFDAAVSTLEPRHRAMLGLPSTPLQRVVPLHATTAAVLRGARVLLGPQTQAELAARRRLDRLAAS
ncbi:oxygenase MpaB family protein [Leifsonia virtsii]|uniref:Oxygenase MpaB family protein n=1 Tax=Leifsonia virtsii TaxID=3035915 RepID=A0ABT8IUF9_9MICO|nr:oxygenase MpaB family protein [Leifsonia virtsii]MDN4596425.1 oxygenase MpaB family protein [Leifsonia virtsii]